MCLFNKDEINFHSILPRNASYQLVVCDVEAFTIGVNNKKNIANCNFDFRSVIDEQNTIRSACYLTLIRSHFGINKANHRLQHFSNFLSDINIIKTIVSNDVLIEDTSLSFPQNSYSKYRHSNSLWSNLNLNNENDTIKSLIVRINW